MNEIKCPNCGKLFQVDEASYAAILKQVRDDAFQRELDKRAAEIEEKKDNELKLKELEKTQEIHKKLEEKDERITELKKKVEDFEKEKEADLFKVRENYLKEINDEKQKNIKLESEKHTLELEKELEIERLKGEHEKEKQELEQEIEYYRNFKSRQTIKLLGETLERHCEIEFNKLRAMGFPHAYFEKDNDIKTGSKGDYIFRDYDENGDEVVSIMFEMKNENDTTANKKKNKDFFKELDKDRREKKCEYAVLVTMLEAEDELYNSGIVDVSHKYEKMYVVRPQFFIPIITLIRNLALNILPYKKELGVIQNQSIDIKNFEDKLKEFKEKFSKNYNSAKNHFETAIDEIDKTIFHLNKIKNSLLSSINQLRLANDKTDELTIKRLTKDNPTMIEAFSTIECIEE